jgi:hypothetical protein
MSWLDLHAVNKNNDKCYITKSIIHTNLYENNNFDVFPESYQYIEYKEPLDAYNLIASDLNEMKNFKSYRLSTPDTEYGHLELTAHDDGNKDLHITKIYKIYNPKHEEIKETYKLLKTNYLHKCF